MHHCPNYQNSLISIIWSSDFVWHIIGTLAQSRWDCDPLFSLLPPRLYSLNTHYPSFSAKTSAFKEKLHVKSASSNSRWSKWLSMSNGAEVEPSCAPCVKGENIFLQRDLPKISQNVAWLYCWNSSLPLPVIKSGSLQSYLLCTVRMKIWVEWRDQNRWL